MEQCLRGVTPIRPGWLLARGPEGLRGPKGPNDSHERASMWVGDQETFWPGAPTLGVTLLVQTQRVLAILSDMRVFQMPLPHIFVEAGTFPFQSTFLITVPDSSLPVEN